MEEYSLNRKTKSKDVQTSGACFSKVPNSKVPNNFYIQKSNTEIERKSFSRIGAKLWNEIPTKLRELPKATFKKKIIMILLNILENEDSYKDLESIISKVNFYSS